jgi:hypothetical protein
MRLNLPTLTHSSECFPVRGMLLVLCALSLSFSMGCRKSTTVNRGIASATPIPASADVAGTLSPGSTRVEPGPAPTGTPGVASGPLTVSSIPFGEANGLKKYKASAIVPLGDSRFLFCDSHTNNAIFELNLTPDGRKNGALIRRPLQGVAPGAADDLEDMTTAEEGAQRYVFLTSSMRVKKAKKRMTNIPSGGVLRVKVRNDNQFTAENLSGFREWLIAAYPQLAPFARIKADHGGLNIEGLAWDKSRQALLFGVRTPSPGGRPLILPVKIKDLAGSWSLTNLEALPAIQLTLESSIMGQGIRALAYDSDRKAFLVITGKSIDHSRAPFALYEWNGGAEGATKRLNIRFARNMQPEGITRGEVSGKRALVIVDDEGGFQVLWGDQQLTYAGAM